MSSFLCAPLGTRRGRGGYVEDGSSRQDVPIVVREGVYLTWEELWVTMSKPSGKDGKKAIILESQTGYAKPGQLLAVMGPSGCGKTTLLDALAGRLNSKAKQTGDILINGRKQALAYGTSAYLTQDDAMLTTLTVEEAVYYSAQLQLPDSMSKFEKKERAEFTIKEMGLQDAIHTRIGGCGSKGISGGQKRRVSICIEIITRPNLLFLDEPTSGLDSAASFYVMNRIARLNKTDGIQRTIIASIHQPNTQVFQLFHNLCLLSNGKLVYFGPASAANKFFALNGFPCPTLQNPSDHFVKAINKDFELEDPEQGLTDGLTTEEAIYMLVKSYQSSEISQQIQTEIVAIRTGDSSAMEKKSNAAFFTQCIVLTRRSYLNMYRDLGYYWLRLFIYGALAICLGTIFYNIGSSKESAQARGSLLMFVATFLTFITIGGFPSFVEEMKVFEKERLNGHYGVTAYIIGQTLSSIPYILLISLIPGALVYYLTNLHHSCQHFVYFTCVLFVSVMLVESLMMIVASMVPNFLTGIITGCGILGVMMLNGGFYKLPSDLPKPIWKYPLYYISIHKYAYQGLFKNEFEGLIFTNKNNNDQVGEHMKNISGEEMLRDLWEVEMCHSKWVDLFILLGMLVLYRVLFLVIIKAMEKVKPIVAAFKWK
ncbi:hypothetical protein HN51_057995 [Arachis hypogaea]|uniref:ABC transporter domain-containing protein n=2 Tax=Arachis hypogaea TaxID=3818 RepID=A0A444WZ25_ARAHY|nr:ABC transporter G family member 11-like [Arachis ipaensis]XP_025685898.1 ABC transporter G family member 11 [Arachis hypogaea]QHN81133.1 ABC transporter G family member [Arachis hypogaea]RYQ82655.1 hypothetical protein Ahy_B10g101232 isoform A [Arachis hypogaea]